MDIADFSPALAPAFKSLNEAWIRKFFEIEPKDAEILAAPEKIVEAGGHIVFVMEDGVAVGCCALIPMADGGFEVSKMAVAASHQGRGLGRALMEACIDRARAAGAPRLYLESGSILRPALALYHSVGFVDLPPHRRPVSPYARADVWMELKL